jgi:lysophospholipase L1-like esterase
VVLAPGFEGEREWPEAPEGKIEIHTNNMGFREDQPTLLEKHGLRILVVGDSHTEGAVSAKDSYSNVLERLLSEERGEPVEVINAAVGGTGPHNFLGMIRKQLVLEPDMVIAACYSGNDFMNALTVSDFFTKRPSRPRTPEYRDPLQAANERWPDLLAQGFNQAYYFAWAEGDAQVAQQVTIDVFGQMADLCEEHGIRFAAVILPSKPDVDTDDDRIDAILGDLGLTREQFAVNLQLARNLAAALRAREIPCVDPTDAMRASDTPYYWKKDHHLDIAGHALVARLLKQELF